MVGLRYTIAKFVHKHPVLYFAARSAKTILRPVKNAITSCVDLTRKRDKYCVICGHKVGKFLKRAKACPYCGAWHRNRWQYYVLKNHSNILTEKCRVLHFAAERHNSKLIRSNRQCEYFTADIIPGRADYVVDITNIQFEDNYFDYIIANHVLEHILDDRKAFSEMARVLKPTGTMILSIPVSKNPQTYEDPSITSEEGRLKAFGQEDHVRLYGQDFKERIAGYGIKIHVIYSPKDELSDEEIERCGFIKNDMSMFCSK